MGGITGNFEEAIREASRVLAVRGQIMPSTLENVTLCAELKGGSHVVGESQLSAANLAIERVYLQPERPAAFPDAVRAILEADIVVIGPGSLYTSLLPNLLVDGIAKALASTQALRLYVCNVATEPGEMDELRASDHVQALLKHLRGTPVDVVLANTNQSVAIRPDSKVQHVVADVDRIEKLGIEVAQYDVVDPHNALRHSPERLAAAVAQIYERHRTNGNGSARAVQAATVV
jgi:uncharacterized cofD-like protein